jgi:hypothetical protein
MGQTFAANSKEVKTSFDHCNLVNILVESLVRFLNKKILLFLTEGFSLFVK